MTKMADELPSCSVLICTHSRAAQLRNCLHALNLQSVKPFEIIVVENGGAEVEVRRAADEFGARYLHSPEPGLSLARNQGWLLSRGKVVAYIDDDCLPERDWCEQISQAFQDSTVTAIGGRIIPPDSDEQSRALCMQLQGEGRLAPEDVHRGDEGWFRKAAFGKIGTGGNMAFRRSLLQTWSGFDERLGLPHSSCEDLYAFLTIAHLGHRVAYVPNALVRHPCPMPSAAELQESVDSMSASTIRYFMFLLFESKRYRVEMMRFLRSAIANRLWSTKAQRRGVQGSGQQRVLAGAVRGMWEYLSSRWSREYQERALRTSL